MVIYEEGSHDGNVVNSSALASNAKFLEVVGAIAASLAVIGVRPLFNCASSYSHDRQMLISAQAIFDMDFKMSSLRF